MHAVGSKQTVAHKHDILFFLSYGPCLDYDTQKPSVKATKKRIRPVGGIQDVFMCLFISLILRVFMIDAVRIWHSGLNKDSRWLYVSNKEYS
jgi:hypothetical protein